MTNQTLIHLRDVTGAWLLCASKTAPRKSAYSKTARTLTTSDGSWKNLPNRCPKCETLSVRN